MTRYYVTSKLTERYYVTSKLNERYYVTSKLNERYYVTSKLTERYYVTSKLTERYYVTSKLNERYYITSKLNERYYEQYLIFLWYFQAGGEWRSILCELTEDTCLALLEKWGNLASMHQNLLIHFLNATLALHLPHLGRFAFFIYIFLFFFIFFS